MEEPKAITRKVLRRAEPAIRYGLGTAIRDGALPAAALQHVLLELFGDEQPEDARWMFLVFASPIARQLWLDASGDHCRFVGQRVRVADLKDWYSQLDRLLSRMVDLYFIAGLSTTDEVAEALQVAKVAKKSPKDVQNELVRAAKWMRNHLSAERRCV